MDSQNCLFSKEVMAALTVTASVDRVTVQNHRRVTVQNQNHQLELALGGSGELGDQAMAA